MEVFRRQDAEQGVRVAQVLEGFISRKVVKQTVMTVVYGVTRYGGRLQIEKRLRELSDFPQVCTFTSGPSCRFSRAVARGPPAALAEGGGGRDPQEGATPLARGVWTWSLRQPCEAGLPWAVGAGVGRPSCRSAPPPSPCSRPGVRVGGLPLPRAPGVQQPPRDVLRHPSHPGMSLAHPSQARLPGPGRC